MSWNSISFCLGDDGVGVKPCQFNSRDKSITIYFENSFNLYSDEFREIPQGLYMDKVLQVIADTIFKDAGCLFGGSGGRLQRTFYLLEKVLHIGDSGETKGGKSGDDRGQIGEDARLIFHLAIPNEIQQIVLSLKTIQTIFSSKYVEICIEDNSALPRDLSKMVQLAINYIPRRKMNIIPFPASAFGIVTLYDTEFGVREGEFLNRQPYTGKQRARQIDEKKKEKNPTYSMLYQKVHERFNRLNDQKVDSDRHRSEVISKFERLCGNNATLPQQIKQSNDKLRSYCRTLEAMNVRHDLRSDMCKFIKSQDRRIKEFIDLRSSAVQNIERIRDFGTKNVISGSVHKYRTKDKKLTEDIRVLKQRYISYPIQLSIIKEELIIIIERSANRYLEMLTSSKPTSKKTLELFKQKFNYCRIKLVGRTRNAVAEIKYDTDSMTITDLQRFINTTFDACKECSWGFRGSSRAHDCLASELSPGYIKFNVREKAVTFKLGDKIKFHDYILDAEDEARRTKLQLIESYENLLIRRSLELTETYKGGKVHMKTYMQSLEEAHNQGQKYISELNDVKVLKPGDEKLYNTFEQEAEEAIQKYRRSHVDDEGNHAESKSSSPGKTDSMGSKEEGAKIKPLWAPPPERFKAGGAAGKGQFLPQLSILQIIDESHKNPRRAKNDLLAKIQNRDINLYEIYNHYIRASGPEAVQSIWEKIRAPWLKMFWKYKSMTKIVKLTSAVDVQIARLTAVRYFSSKGSTAKAEELYEVSEREKEEINEFIVQADMRPLDYEEVRYIALKYYYSMHAKLSDNRDKSKQTMTTSLKAINKVMIEIGLGDHAMTCSVKDKCRVVCKNMDLTIR